MRKFFSELRESWPLIKLWTRYHIEASYLETRLGALWIILEPVLITLIYATVFSLILDRLPRNNVPFVIFFLSGMIFWQFFSNTLMKASTLISSKTAMVSQIKFSRQSLVFVAFLEMTVDLGVTFIVLMILDAFYGIYPSVQYIYLPILLFVFFSLTIGLMFMLTTLGVFIQDTQQLTGLVLRFLMYFSGVIISADMLPKKALKVLVYNPLFFMIESFRNIILYSEPPNMKAMSVWLVVSVLFLIAGIVFFKTNDGKFSDYQ